MIISIGISSTIAEYKQGYASEYYICDPYPLDDANKICHITLYPGMHNVYTYWTDKYNPETLICISCNVLTFPKTFYQNFELLKIINFSNSHLVQLQLTSIPYKPLSLQTLDVSRNEIETLDGTSMFNFAPKLEHIDLSYNKIYEISAASTFDRLRTPSLFRLDLSYNAIATLEAATFSKLPCLKSLKLNNNQLQNVSNLFDEIEMLSYLDLSFNAITALDPDTFSKISNLEVLNVSSNTLLTLNTMNLIRSNQRLMHLQVNNNVLTNIQAVNARNLKVLQANGNQIISVHLIGTTSLEVLDLSKNILNIKDFITIGLGELRVLNLAHNNLTSIRTVTSKLTPKLEALDVSFNQINDLDTDTLSHLTGLHLLNLEHSGITTIGKSTFSGLSQLISLDISYNELGTLDLRMLNGLTDLTEIFMDGNNLRNIGLYGLKENLPSLKTIGISDNAWRCTVLSSMLSQLYSIGVQIYVENPLFNDGDDHVAGVGCTDDVGTTELVPIEGRTFADNRQHHMNELENKVMQTYLMDPMNDLLPVKTEDVMVQTSCNCNTTAVEPNLDEDGPCSVLVERIDMQTLELKRLSEAIASSKNCNVTVDTIEANKLQGPTPRNTFLLSTVWLMAILNVALIATSVWLYRRLRYKAECHCRIDNEL